MREFFGALFMVVGLLIVLLSGLCTGIFLIAFLRESGDLSSIALPLYLGVPTIAVGFGMFAIGRVMVRSNRPRDEI